MLGRYSVFKIKEVFINELELGLQENPKRQSSLQMENTFLPGLPNGSGAKIANIRYCDVFMRMLFLLCINRDF